MILIGLQGILDRRITYAESRAPSLVGIDALRYGIGAGGVGLYFLILALLLPLWPTLDQWRRRHQALNVLALLCVSATFILSCWPWRIGRELFATAAWASPIALGIAILVPRAIRERVVGGVLLMIGLAFFVFLIGASVGAWGRPLLFGLLWGILLSLCWAAHFGLLLPRSRTRILSDVRWTPE